jgi:hypothetical protein
MKTLTIAAVAALALSGCNAIPKPTPEPLSVTLKAVADAAKEAGCTVNFSLGFGGATGQLGGGAHLENTLSGGCDPAKVQTLQQYGNSLPAKP